jgi:hypothetical protein
MGQVVSANFFSVLSVSALRGRTFVSAEDSGPGAHPVAIVSHSAWQGLFGGDPQIVGREVTLNGLRYTIVGITPADFKGPLPLAALDPDLPVSDVRTMNNHLGIALLPARLAGSVLGIFGALGLMLAAVGMYGVMSYSVSQRRREIGIHVAIGAARSQVLALVMRQGLRMVAIGTAIGLVGVVLGTRLVRSMLYGASGMDVTTLVVVPFVLIAVAAFAIWFPARRAAAVDPMVALRGE